jgi:cyclophilin family peptidyl-prolyl cis-trans isomerase
MESALRLVTTKGNVDVILYQTQTPVTVTNFLGYVNRGDFADSAFHRISTLADSGVEVLQGGQYKVSAASTQSFTSIPTQPTIANEPGISNQPYTVAMAKQGGNPNSATSQFYFNLNPANTTLDDPDSNGGFTVFGRVSLPTRAAIDALKGFPGGPYSVTVDGQAGTIPFKWPMNVASQGAVPGTMDNTKVMKIISAAPITTLLTYAAVSSAPAAATAAVSGGDVQINALAPGLTTVTVTATDLDGGQTNQQFTVTVNDTFAAWAARNSLPGAADEPLEDADADGATNLEEFALFSNPSAGSEQGRPAPSQTGADPVGRITFKTRKFAPSLTYIVQASDTLLSPDWVDIWNSATDGYASPRVTVDQDNADHRVITITDVETIVTGQPRRFLRVKVVQAP